MSRLLRAAVVVGALATSGGCQSAPRHGMSDADSTVLAERETRLQQELAHPDSDPSQPLARWRLPERLMEISGLALTTDGRLLTHGDNHGVVFEIDYRRGVVRKEFTLGKPTVNADFEAITTVGDSVILLASDGVLYRFVEGGNGKSVNYTEEDTGLGAKCEFEGVAYDSTLKALLLACKHVHDKAMKDSVIIYRWPVGAVNDTAKTRTTDVSKVSYLAIPMARIIGSNDWTELYPSDITIDPFNGNYLLIASRQKALFEVTPAGAVVFARPLPPGHELAEGVAITRDSILIISDEARAGPALITLYRWRK